MAVVISGANFNQDETVKSASINYKNNTGAVGNDASTGKAAGVKTFASAVVSKGDGANLGKDATYKSLLAEADDVKSQIMASAATAKDSLKALFNKMSGAEAVQIDQDGFNLTTASPEDCVNIVEKIKIELAMHCEDYVPTGTPISADKIAQVTGSAGMANEVASKMSQAGIVPTEDNLTQVEGALDEASKITPMSESVKNFMVANQVEPSIDGIYQAAYAVGTVEKSGAMSDTFEALRPQIEQIITGAGLEINDQNLNNAKAFLQNQIPVTKENLAYKAQLDSMDLSEMNTNEKQNQVLDLIMKNMVIGESAGSTALTGEEPILTQVADVIDILNKSDINTIEQMMKNQTATNQTATNQTLSDQNESTVSGKGQDGFTVQDLKEVLQPDNKIVDSTECGSGAEIVAATEYGTGAAAESGLVQDNYKQLQEIRILMTADAGVFLAKQGVNLYTTSVYEMNLQLKAYDQANSLGNLVGTELEGNALASIDETNETMLAEGDQLYAQFFSVKMAMYDIEQAPEDVIGQVLAGLSGEMGAQEHLTIAAFAQRGSNLRQQYDKAGKTYEAVGTEVRTDLGDSISKAVSNSTSDLLNELGLEDNEHNRAAVRILAANGMEITEENVEQVKTLNETLKNLINNMKPETVLSMIRENVNPLTDHISDVNQYLVEQNAKSTEDTSEKYSRFLYKLDQTEGITAEERSQFIGIYKMMNIFTKDAGKAVGALVKQGADVTMGNLMTAYESRKSYGMDVSLDDETGVVQGQESVSYYQSLFMNTKDQVTPHTLLETGKEQSIESYSVEDFCETIDGYYDPEVEAESLKGYVEQLKESVEVDQAVFRQLEISGQTVNINNIQAAEQLLSSGMFPKINGKDVKDGIEKIGHESDLRQMYEELSDESDAALTEALQSSENQTYEDMNAARMSNHEIGFIKNLSMRNDYHIPIETKDGTSMVHLTLISDHENSGRISIEMSQSEIGTVSMEAKVSSEKTDIFVLQRSSGATGSVNLEQVNDSAGTDEKGQKENLAERLEQMESALTEIFDIPKVNIYQSNTDRMPERYYPQAAEQTATDQLYGMAQTMIRVLAGQE